MANIRTSISPQMCRLLSELLQFETSGLRPAELAMAADMELHVVYAQAQKMDRRKLIRKSSEGNPRSAVTYLITEKGKQAREEFARELGLNP